MTFNIHDDPTFGYVTMTAQNPQIEEALLGCFGLSRHSLIQALKQRLARRHMQSAETHYAYGYANGKRLLTELA